MEEEMKINQPSSSPPPFACEGIPFSSGQPEDYIVEPAPTTNYPNMVLKEEDQEVIKVEEYFVDFESTKEEKKGCSTPLQLPFGNINLPQIQVPNYTNNTDWSQDGFWTQFNSPCLANMILTPPATLLNF